MRDVVYLSCPWSNETCEKTYSDKTEVVDTTTIRLLSWKKHKVFWKVFSENSGNSKNDRIIGETLINNVASNGECTKANYAGEYFKNTKRGKD